MINLVPGALWRPIDVGNRAARRKGRGLIGHIAVVNSTLLVPGPLATRPSDWHFYLPKNPYPTGQRFAQLIDLDLQSWSSGDANATCASYESEGGVGADVDGSWTPNQVEAAAMILAHMHRTEGVPLQDMGNSLPTSRGFGVHRYGIDPYRVAGGEKWSKSYAKACPGNARVRQVGAIVARAQQLVNGDDMPLSDDDLRKVYQAVWFGVGGAQLIPNLRRDPNGKVGEWPYTSLGAMDGRLQNEIIPPALQPIKDQLTRLEQKVATAAPTQAAVSVDAAAVAAALGKDATFLAAIAKAVADESYRRQES